MKFDIIAGTYYVHQHDPNKKPNPLDKFTQSMKPDTMGISEVLKMVAGLLCAIAAAIGKHEDISKLLDQFDALLGGSSVQTAIILKESKEASAEIKEMIDQVLKDLKGDTKETASDTKSNDLGLIQLEG